MPESEEPGVATVGTGNDAAGAPGGGVAPSIGAQLPGPQVSAWAGDLSDRLVDGVGWVKARTTVPVVKILRAVVYGLVILIAALTAVVLTAIGLVRIWDAYLPVHPLGRRVWLGYVVLGGLLSVAGGVLMARRATRRAGR